MEDRKREKKHTAFEKKVSRIFRLLEDSKSFVKWDHRTRDPDTGQVRQVDILIEREDGKTIYVECRDRATPQDTPWIEELIGKRLSLRPDHIFAVSSSGFTAPARRKATAHSIPTYTLEDFSRKEMISQISSATVFLFTALKPKVSIHASGPPGLERPISSRLIRRTAEQLDGFFEQIRHAFTKTIQSGEEISSDYIMELVNSLNEMIFTYTVGLKVHFEAVCRAVGAPAVCSELFIDSPAGSEKQSFRSVASYGEASLRQVSVQYLTLDEHTEVVLEYKDVPVGTGEVLFGGIGLASHLQQSAFGTIHVRPTTPLPYETELHITYNGQEIGRFKIVCSIDPQHVSPEYLDQFGKSDPSIPMAEELVGPLDLSPIIRRRDVGE